MDDGWIEIYVVHAVVYCYCLAILTLFRVGLMVSFILGLWQRYILISDIFTSFVTKFFL